MEVLQGAVLNHDGKGAHPGRVSLREREEEEEVIYDSLGKDKGASVQTALERRGWAGHSQ